MSGAPQDRIIADVIYAASSSLGFATGQALLYTVQIVSDEKQINSDAFYISVAVILFLMPLHVLTGYTIGLRLTILHYYNSHPDDPTYTRPGCLGNSFKGIIFVPVLLRSILNAVFFSLVFLDVSGGTWILLGTSFVVCTAAVIHTKVVERRLPTEYLHRVGYLHVMGYGVLADH